MARVGARRSLTTFEVQGGTPWGCRAFNDRDRPPNAGLAQNDSAASTSRLARRDHSSVHEQPTLGVDERYVGPL